MAPFRPLRPKKALGQHFLRDPNLIRKIVAAVEPGPEDLVLEYGAGTGALTRPLAAAGGALVAVEVDPDLLVGLREDPELAAVHWRSEGLEFMSPGRVADEFGLLRLKLAGNLPYQLSSTALIQAAEEAHRLERVVFMLQREVAERVQARPGSRRFGILPALVQARFEVEKICDIGPKAFFPPPAVQSRVLRLWPLAETGVSPELWPRYRQLVDRLFRERRKQLRNPLRKFYRLDDAALAKLAATEDLDLSRRPETLSVEEIARLATQLPTANP